MHENPDSSVKLIEIITVWFTSGCPKTVTKTLNDSTGLYFICTPNSKPMKYAVDKQERHTVFTVQEGNLNSVVAPELKSEFVLLSNEGVQNLIVDLSQVEYIDSSGLSSILTANRLWKDLGSFILTGEMQPNVKRLITMSRLDSVLTIIPTVAESIDFAYMEELQRDLTKED